MDVLQQALTECGVTDPSTSDKIMYSILDGSVPSTGTSHASGAKGDYYNQLSPPYNCPKWADGGYFRTAARPGRHIGNLLGIQLHQPSPGGLPAKGVRSHPALQQEPVYNEANNAPNPRGLVELFSPFGKQLNINTASAKTLQLLPGIDANTAARIVQMRAGPDGIDGTEDDVPFHSVAELNSGLPGGGISPGMPPAARGPPARRRADRGHATGECRPGASGAPPAGSPPADWRLYCDVRSYVFEVHVEAEINGVKRTFIGIAARSPQNPAKLDCTRFYWE